MNDTMDMVERITRRRARVASAMGALFVATQLAHLHEGPMRTVDYVALAGWAVWAMVLVVFVLFGGGLLRGPAVRGMLNDEGTEANRRNALITGFWAMFTAAVALFASSFYEPLSGRSALHIVITAGVGFALLRFGMLERRALRE
ncbi:MAG: hypothetical protein P0Y56_10060 [Candidatus Andeanibacterium colombiense]|uniref:Uncharacterized protein n=1 Tax=Candidatus Andeanibacterium colombiense TaxID=3121345 RepID=A0AAJ5X7D1_9SPHN|nr:MAG: hypothetical protein P0Y56_10060 [Sphingomonadaceae bacterium]